MHRVTGTSSDATECPNKQFPNASFMGLVEQSVKMPLVVDGSFFEGFCARFFFFFFNLSPFFFSVVSRLGDAIDHGTTRTV